jgi:signal recognition particle receptor subunit beta
LFSLLIQKKSKNIQSLVLILYREKYGEAAEILYEILNNITVLSDRVPLLVACNKQDLQFAKKATVIESELECEIEELRKVRKATQDDPTKMGYLESLKKKFSFNDIQMPIKFVECSLNKEELGEVYKFVYSNF